jgi:hypothetical protein
VDALHQFVDVAGPIEKGVIGMQVQVDEFRHGASSILWVSTGYGKDFRNVEIAPLVDIQKSNSGQLLCREPPGRVPQAALRSPHLKQQVSAQLRTRERIRESVNRASTLVCGKRVCFRPGGYKLADHHPNHHISIYQPERHDNGKDQENA